MDKEFSVLNYAWMWHLVYTCKAATKLYHLLGGKETHAVMRSRWVESGKSISCDLLAKDNNDLTHAMSLRFVESLDEVKNFKEHWLADLWEYEVDGEEYSCTPATQMLVYFLNDRLPGDKQVCRTGFLLVPDDIDINAQMPTQIISTVTDDGSELAKLIQYLRRPTRNRTEFGPLADRVDDLLDAWEERKRGDKEL